MEVVRKEYFQRLLSWKDKKMIKVITGIRRCGKSTLLKMFREYLLEHGIGESQMISINFEDYEYQELWQPKALYQYIKERLQPGKMTYLFLDEIQNVKEFQRVVDSFFLRDNVDIYITGSNSYMLSGELATLLTGRYIQIEMLPFSFAEYVQMHGMESSVEEAYRNYI